MKNPQLQNADIARLCRSLSLLLHSGISQADSLHLMAKEEGHPWDAVLAEMGTALDGGAYLSDVLENSGVFPRYVYGMVRIGEETGRTEEALTSLADYYNERCRVNKLIRSSLAYPSLILGVMLVVVGVLLIKVLHVFDAVYASMGSRLTGLAGGLLQAGQALEHLLPVLFGLLLLVILAAALFSLCPPCRRAMTQFFQKHLGDCGIFRKFHNARFARALAMGLQSGLSLDEAMDLARMLLSDAPSALRRCTDCMAMLAENMSLAEAVEKTGLLPPASGRLLALGLRGGSADAVMQTIADDLSQEAEDSLQSAIGRIEPAMVVAASVLVGVILLSVMLPLMNILSSIG